MLKKTAYYLLIALLVASTPAQYIYFRSYAEPRWGNIEVIVAAKEISRGDIIPPESLRVMRVKADSVVDKEILDVNKIKGQESTRLIRKGERITEDMVNNDRLMPGKDEYNMPMPTEWVLAMPGSMLRGDQISLIPVKKEEEADTSHKAGAREETNASAITPKTDEVSQEEIELLQDIRVSYSKSSNNQEVTSSDDRKKPTGTVNRFEMIVNNKQRDVITKYGKQGYKFLVSYR